MALIDMDDRSECNTLEGSGFPPLAKKRKVEVSTERREGRKRAELQALETTLSPSMTHPLGMVKMPRP